MFHFSTIFFDGLFCSYRYYSYFVHQYRLLPSLPQHIKGFHRLENVMKMDGHASNIGAPDIALTRPEYAEVDPEESDPDY